MPKSSTMLDQVYGHQVHSEMENEVLTEALSTVFLSFSFCDASLCSAIHSANMYQNTRSTHLMHCTGSVVIVFPFEIHL